MNKPQVDSNREVRSRFCPAPSLKELTYNDLIQCYLKVTPVNRVSYFSNIKKRFILFFRGEVVEIMPVPTPFVQQCMRDLGLTEGKPLGEEYLVRVVSIYRCEDAEGCNYVLTLESSGFRFSTNFNWLRKVG